MKDADIQIGEIYQHYKGPSYRIHGLVRHSETLEELVLYECLYENDLGKMWVRPKQMFLQMIELNGTMTPRFQLIREETT